MAKNSLSTSRSVLPITPSTQLLDLGSNGLEIKREQRSVYVQLVHEGRTLTSRRVIECQDFATAEAVRMAGKVICAAATAAIDPDIVVAALQRLLYEIEDLGVKFSRACEPGYFRYQMEPDIEYSFADPLRNGIVVGHFGLFAELQPMRGNETSDRSRKETGEN